MALKRRRLAHRRFGGEFHNHGRVVVESTRSVAFNPGSSNTFNDAYVNDGLVGCWNTDESTISSSSSAADISGYGHTAYHLNTPTAYRATQVDPVGGSDVISAGGNWGVTLWPVCIATKTTLDYAWHHIAITHNTSGAAINFDGGTPTVCTGGSHNTAIDYDIGRA